MTETEEIEYYRNTLEEGMYAICEAMGVSSERYDTDQADGECYLDCFREAAKLIKLAGYTWDDEENEWVSSCFKAN